jgi:hypothetical protein
MDMWPFSVEKGEPGPVEGRHRQFKLATNNSISHHEHVLYRLKLGYELINQALDFGQNGARKQVLDFFWSQAVDVCDLPVAQLV